MLGNFIFSLNIVIPIFFVMFVGYILNKRNFINEAFIQVANKLIFYVALPIKIFNDVLNTELGDGIDGRFLLFIILGTLFSFILSILVGLISLKEKSKLGAFVQGAFRGNYLYVGLSIFENIKGFISINASLIIAFSLPLYNVLSILILSLSGKNKSKLNLKDISLSIIKNPLILAALLGLGINLTGYKLPDTIFNTMGYFRELVTPLALITIGASFEFKRKSKNNIPALIASGLKLVLVPLLAIIAAYYLNFSNEDILLVYIYFGVPTALVSYVLTSSMDGDRELAANIILVTTILSIFTTTGFIFAFKTLGLI